MTNVRTLALVAGLLLALPALGWEVGEFRNGMTRAELDEALKSWNFDQRLMVGSDSVYVYDGPDNPAGRRFLFTFCNDRLVSFSQEIEPTFGHFVIVASNYSSLYGHPLEVVPQTSVIASGQTSQLAMFWRKGPDYVGLRYAELPASEKLTMTWQVSNNCWQAPR